MRASPAGGSGVTWAVSLVARERVIGYRRTRGSAKLTRFCIASGDSVAGVSGGVGGNSKAGGVSVGEAGGVVAGVSGGVSGKSKFSLFSTTWL